MVSILNNQRLLSIAEAAQLLGVTRKAVYHYSDAAIRKQLGKAWLETCLVGGRRKTTLECCQRFLRQEEPSDEPTHSTIDMSAHEQAVRDLAAM